MSRRSTWRRTGPRQLADVVDAPRVARRLRDALVLLPFLVFVGIFLIIPTVTVVVSAFYLDGTFSFERVGALFSATALTALWRSIVLSAATAVIGAVFGAALAGLFVGRPVESTLRRVVLALSSVLAQFGGVALAFAFLATIGLNGVLTVWAAEHLGLDLAGDGWLYSLPGLILVYTYFQIPLMVIVFLPALEGLRAQWREAAVSLGATPWQYWREVGFPLLAPAFFGSMLLLFANAFAAYATAAALVSQGSPIVPLLIRSALTSEVVLGQEGFAYALALEMIVVVAVVMIGYHVLTRRTARWLQ
ncbi:ABC transporter permease subunit [Mycolicibacterium confluentis]|nr:ABC transporter permease subunit [Mycolicibacterium confluentis]